MAVEIIAPSGNKPEVDATLDALKVAPRPPEAEGFYFHNCRSGALAGAAAASIVYALRWPHASKLCVLDLLRIRAMPTTPFTAAQAYGFEAVVARTFTAQYNAGAGLQTFLPSADSSNAFKKKTTYPTSNITSIVMAGTAAITGGTATLDTSSFLNDYTWELAAGATVARSIVICFKDYTDGNDGPPIFQQNEGFVVRPTHTLGAAGVILLSVEVAWHEVTDATKL